jgi:exonuclease 3'-5' domain-containing protein 1
LPHRKHTEEDHLTEIISKVDSLIISEPNKSFQRTASNQAFSLIDTKDALAKLIDSLSELPNVPPSLYIDLEGVNLSRHGTVSILQLLVSPKNHVYVIDICALQHQGFSTPGKNGQTLKTILESSEIQKAFFDVRHDADALYSHFGVNLAGVQDIQLMELACRAGRKKFLNGLSKCIERDGMLTRSEKQRWKDVKDKGLHLFAPERGGTYEVFNHRPLDDRIMSYCVQDVQFLARLWCTYYPKMTPRWREKVQAETKKRITSSQSPSFNGEGQHMALAPWQ